MSQLTDFGKGVKKTLIDLGKSQTWLQEQITARTGLYVDSGYLNKLFTGKRPAKNITAAITAILEEAKSDE